MSTIKFILIGDSGVGKTCLINQYINQKFTYNQLPTITAGDKYTKELNLCNKVLSLEIWDTVGQERFRSLNKIYLNNAKIAAIVYDITNQETFDNLKKWYKDIKEKNNTIKIIGILANKSDLYEEKVVSKEEGENYANSINGFFYETSAMDYESVSNAFEGLTKKYVENVLCEDNKIIKNIVNSKNENDSIKLKNNKKKIEEKKFLRC